jgi:hypothetical protein
MQRTAKLTMQPAFGQPTTNQRRRDKTYKTIPQSMEGYTMVKIDAPVPTWVKRKIKK